MVDLHHHGDQEATPGLLDFAVNVHPEPAPQWLRQELVESLTTLGRYPDLSAALPVVAGAFSRDVDEVLLTSGAAEAFTLLARARPWRLAAVVHPQFTEPEAALRAAGVPVRRVVLERADQFALAPGVVPDEADLVVIGNPTNPTGVLHPREALLSLIRPGRVLVVDEAFMDAVPDEPESLARTRTPGVVVIRSLTKTWSIAGLRAGFVLGDAEVLALMTRQQSPWSVNSLALVALAACHTPQGLAETGRRARQLDRWRQETLAELPAWLTLLAPSRAPFVLVGGASGLRDHLRSRGVAVRRGDTFPGLDDSVIRLAARPHSWRRELWRACEE